MSKELVSISPTAESMGHALGAVVAGLGDTLTNVQRVESLLCMAALMATYYGRKWGISRTDLQKLFDGACDAQEASR